MYAIRWADHVDMDQHAFNLPPSMTKSGKAQTIPMIDDVREALIELQGIQRELVELHAEADELDKEPQRMVAGGRVFNISENREWWKAAKAEAGVKDLRWHDLRHTFASRLVLAGYNMKIVQEGCGHQSLAVTQRYAHINQETLADAMASLNRKK